MKILAIGFLAAAAMAGELGVVSTNEFLIWDDVNAGRSDRSGYHVYVASSTYRFDRIKVATNRFAFGSLTNQVGRKFVFVTAVQTNGVESVPSEIGVFQFGALLSGPSTVKIER